MDAEPHILKLFVKILGWMLLYYVLASLPPFAIEEMRKVSGPKDIHIYRDYPHSIYANTASFAVYDLAGLDDYPYQVFILGSSEPGHALIPAVMASTLKGYKVHNLSVAGTNVSELSQTVDIIESRVHMAHLKSAIFVLGLQYVSFLNNSREFGADLTNIDQEKMRHRLYYADGSHTKPVWGVSMMKLANIFIRPFIWIYTLKYDLYDLRDEIIIRLAPTSESSVVNRGDAKKWRSYRLLQFEDRGPDDEQFEELGRLADRLAADGANVVYVDMPLISYFREDFKLYADYRKKLVNLLAHHPAVYYLDLTVRAPDSQFIDHSHAAPQYYPLWTQWIADYLRKLPPPRPAQSR